jgi:hypothetical protein
MNTSLFQEYQKTFETELWLNVADFSAEWQAWQSASATHDIDQYELICHLLKKVKSAISEEFAGNDLLFVKLRPLYFHLWKLYKKQGKNSDTYSKLMHYCDLKRAETNSYKTLVMVIASKCCAACEAIDGQIIPLNEAIEAQPIPQAVCTKPSGCICTYGFHGERDLEGNLQMK